MRQRDGEVVHIISDNVLRRDAIRREKERERERERERKEKGTCYTQ